MNEPPSTGDDREFFDLATHDGVFTVPYWHFDTWKEVQAMFDVIAAEGSDAMNFPQPGIRRGIDGIMYHGVDQNPKRIIAVYTVTEDFDHYASRPADEDTNR